MIGHVFACAQLNSQSNQNKNTIHLQQEDPENPGELDLHFSTSPGGEYWILDTDYDSFTCVYTCSDVPLLNLRKETAWLMTRETNPPPETVCKQNMYTGYYGDMWNGRGLEDALILLLAAFKPFDKHT